MNQSSQIVITTVLLLAAAITLVVAVRTWRRQEEGKLFAVVMLSVTVWLASYAAELALSSLSGKLYAARVEYIGITMLPPYWLLFALTLTSKRHWVTPRTIAVATAIPIITITLAWTSSSHELLWSSAELDRDASATGLIVEYGTWFWVHTAYSYAALVGSNVALIVLFSRAFRFYRRQASIMLVGLLAPWLSNIIYLFLGSETAIDPTPLALAFGGTLVAVGLWHWRLLDVKPLPRARSVEGMRDGVLVLDHLYRVVDYNTSAAALLGIDGRTILGKSVEALMPELGALLATSPPHAAHRISRADPETPDEARVLEIRVSPFNENHSPRTEYWLVILRDVTETDHAERLLRAAEERYRTLVEQMPAVTYIREWSQELRVTYVSPQIEDLLGYAPESIYAGEPPRWEQLIALEDLEDVRWIHNRATEHRDTFAAEYRLKDASGGLVWVRDEAVVIADPEGRPLHWQGIIVDISDQKRLELQLERYAFYDTLTGLPNRALLLDRLEHSLARSQRENKLVGVLFIDLDGFKIINDTLGHVAGDVVLQHVAQRLQASLRSGDTAGRLGGDEFVIVVESVNDSESVLKIAERISEEIRRPIRISGTEVVVSCSIGVRTSHIGDASADEFMRDADVAMYGAKSGGRARVEVYNESMLAHRWNRLGIESELRTAIREDQLSVYYQPIVSLPTGKIVGFEALLRWIHPERGEIPPGEFLQVAEECDLMIEIDQWVLETACKQIAAWQQRISDPDIPPLTISVNITPQHLHEPSVVDDIASTLKESGLSPEQLVLEITENHTMRDASSVGRRLDAITRLGAKVIIDDFGTGYSALSYLRQFSISGIKIDRTFVSGLGIRAEDTSLVHAVVSLAQSFDLEITAEGIETRAQWSDLDTLGANLGQGYLIARPLSVKTIEAYIESGKLSEIVDFPDQPRLRIVSGE